MNMKMDLALLDRYVADGLLVKNEHPELPLVIWNYSRETQYGGFWDEITMACRGLVTDNSGEVVARPFPKFKNYEEYSADEIPNESFDVFEKMDGSCGIVFFYAGEWHIATRGSFASDQAKMGRRMFVKYPMEKLDVRNTYIFEIIYDENRIVVDYNGYEGLVLLGAFNTANNVEVDRTELEALEGFDLVNKYDGVNDFAKLKAIIPNDAEGFVIRFKSGMRMKIKGQEYVRLHRILTNISTTSIWDVLRSGGNFSELLDKVPDEFDGWVRETVRGLNEDFSRIKEDYLNIFARLEEESLNRKDFAIRAKEYAYPSILFSMLDGRDYEKYIWDLVKPDFAKALNNNSLFLKRYLEM